VGVQFPLSKLLNLRDKLLELVRLLVSDGMLAFCTPKQPGQRRIKVAAWHTMCARCPANQYAGSFQR